MRYLLITVSLLLSPSLAHASGLEKLHAFMLETKSAQAKFIQVVLSKSGRKPEEATGAMWFSRPGKFRWVYEKPYSQLIVGDGEKLWIYDKDLNQITVKKMGAAIGSTPAALLAGQGTLEKNFVLTEGAPADGLEWVDAVPKKAAGKAGLDSNFEKVRLGFSGSQLEVMQLTDVFGQTTLLRFGPIQKNPPMNPELFRFVPPKGADVLSE